MNCKQKEDTVRKMVKTIVHSREPLQHLHVTPSQLKIDAHYTFLGNCPPTPPLSQHFALGEK